jgi:hypothetical protein
MAVWVLLLVAVVDSSFSGGFGRPLLRTLFLLDLLLFLASRDGGGGLGWDDTDSFVLVVRPIVRIVEWFEWCFFVPNVMSRLSRDTRRAGSCFSVSSLMTVPRSGVSKRTQTLARQQRLHRAAKEFLFDTPN